MGEQDVLNDTFYELAMPFNLGEGSISLLLFLGDCGRCLDQGDLSKRNMAVNQ